MSRSRMARAWTILQRRGLGYGFELWIDHALPRLMFWLQRNRRSWKVRAAGGSLVLFLLALLSGILFNAMGFVPGLILLCASAFLLFVAQRIWYFVRSSKSILRQADELSSTQKTQPHPETQPHPGARYLGARWDIWPVEETVRQRIEEARRERRDEPLVLARIDNDGRALCLFGPLPNLTSVDEEEFVQRRRFPVELVLTGEHLRVRKTLHQDPKAFWREALPLVRLKGEKCVPTLAALSEEQLRIERFFLCGPTIRDLLVAQGADILSINTATDPKLTELTPEERIEAVWRRAHPHLASALPEGFLEHLEAAMDHLHGLGVTGFSLTYGNIVVEPGVENGNYPVFLDFDNAVWHGQDRGRFAEWRFALHRDQDREKFRRIYDLPILTEATARRLLAAREGHWYAPIDFGQGLAMGGFWTTESGTGRWDFLNGHVVGPLVAGKRVLDLGSNNGVLPLLMLRSGARRVLAVEQEQEWLETARLAHRVFEWRDLKTYAIDFHQADMRFLLDEDPGSFDVISAFCSLYYLEHEEMKRMVQRMAELVPLVILQAKDDTRAAAANDKATKSTSTFLAQLLRENGFPEVEIHAPPGFARPLLIGRRETA